MIVVRFHDNKGPEIVFEGSPEEVKSWLSPFAVDHGCYYEYDKPENISIRTRLYDYYRKYESEDEFNEWMGALQDG